jgi:DNA-binding MarR family transcriptional regulator
MLLLDMHRLGRVASQLMRTVFSDFDLNETQLLIVVHLAETGSGKGGKRRSPMAPVDLAQSIVCPVTTMATQIHKLAARGLISLAVQEHVRDHSESGRQLYSLTKAGDEVADGVCRRLETIDSLLRSVIHRQSDTGVRAMSRLLLEWSRAGALKSATSLNTAARSKRIRIPQRGR